MGKKESIPVCLRAAVEALQGLRASPAPQFPTWYPSKRLCWGWAGTCKGWRSLAGFLCSQKKKKSHQDKGTHVSSQDEALPGDGHPCSSWLHQSWIPELRKPHCRVQFTSEKSLLVMALQIDGFAFSPSVARALLGEGTPHPPDACNDIAMISYKGSSRPEM